MPDDPSNKTTQPPSNTPVVSSEITGTPAEGMELDPRYKAFEEKLQQKWLQQNPGKDFLSYEGQNYLYGRQDGGRARTLTSDTQYDFERQYPEDAKAYKIKEKSRIYDSPANDPAIKQVEKEVLQKTNLDSQVQNTTRSTGMDSYGNMWARVNTRENMRAWDSFTYQYPEKAKAYAERGHDDLKRALERRVELAERSRKHEEEQKIQKIQFEAQMKAEQEKLLREHTEKLEAIRQNVPTKPTDAPNLKSEETIASQPTHQVQVKPEPTTPQAQKIPTPKVGQTVGASPFRNPTLRGIGTPRPTSPITPITMGVRTVPGRNNIANILASLAKTANTLPKERENDEKERQKYDYAYKKWDQSFAMSLATILAIPILIIFAILEIIVGGATPWGSGPS